jgi:predicted HTH transcriptional regulator
MTTRTLDYLQSLVRELVKLPNETEWVEFKCNNTNPERIAHYISGLSNVATLYEKPKAYLLWGVEDRTHKIVGTDFEYRKMKKGDEELEAWLAKMVNPKINFKFFEIPMEDDKTVVLLEIPCAETEPTKFTSVAYIRVGSNLKPLVGFRDKEMELWRKFDTTPYELRVACDNISDDVLVELLDYSGYYKKLEIPIPANRVKVFDDLQNEKFIKKDEAGNWSITNLGALMIASSLKKFEHLARKAIRVVWYKSNNRLEAIREREFAEGYACSHEDIIQYIMTIIPQEEVIIESIRKSVLGFPEIAIRELLANTMIHQALEQRGTSPLVEVFSDRIEFSNAGAPLVAIERIVDAVPLTRNENIAGFMHKCGICEERGSGYDKIVTATSENEMLAPRIENQSNQFTKVVLFAKIPFNLTTKEDRIRTCYMQACLAYISFSAIGNIDIRIIFGIEEKEKYKASRVIKDTLEAGLIKPIDEKAAPRYMKYIPHWA